MSPQDLSSWLSTIDSSRYVTEIGIVASHDSMAYKAYSDGAKRTFLTQEGSDLATQFAGGVRRFDMRTSNNKVTNSWVNFAHGIYQVGDRSDIVFGQLIKSLAYNPSEFVVFNINPYDGKDFKDNNNGLDFWDTLAGQAIHNYFFVDGRALRGTPRVWADYIFDAFAPELPEEKRQLLRGKPMFYTPKFGYDNKTIPTVGELRGKFIVGDDSWTGGKSYTFDQLSQLDSQYANDFPNGIRWDPGSSENEDPTKDRMDLYGYYYLYKQRDKNRQFVDSLVKKRQERPRDPSFLGVYNSNGANVVGSWFGSGLWGTHSDIWFDNYIGDRGTPNFMDLVRSKQVGSVRGTFMTDFAIRENRGTTPAEIITSLQPRVDILTGLNNNLLVEGDKLRIRLKSNIPAQETGDFALVLDGLSDAFNSSDYIVKGGAVLGQESAREALPGADALVIDPGSDQSLTIKFLRNDIDTEYFTAQLLNMDTGLLYGAPQIFDLT